MDSEIRTGATTREIRAPLDGMHRPMSVLPISPKAVNVFDHPGLFAVPVGRPRAVSAAAKKREPPAMLRGRARVAQTDRNSGGLHRYCSGCAQETEHVAWAADGRGSVSTIRRPATEPTIGATTCVDCGQERAATSRPGPLSWSNWPRSPIATPSLTVAPDSTEIADDRASEAAAENEGMPPRSLTLMTRHTSVDLQAESDRRRAGRRLLRIAPIEARRPAPVRAQLDDGDKPGRPV